MRIFAIADLHLSFNTPDKSMDMFGPDWVDHAGRVAKHWKNLVKDEDLVLLAGDISWGKKMENALADLDWIDKLPGKKVLSKGNHDYWWSSLSKMEELPFKTLHYIQNNALTFDSIGIGGTRLWDTNEFDLSPYFPPILNAIIEKDLQEDEKIYRRELLRLEESLKKIPSDAALKIAMVHYPPIGPDLKPTLASALLEKYHIDICVFGHLHGMQKPIPYGKARGVEYHLTSCDFLKCTPKLIHSL